jgi:8-oxo-dGTP pyrophosphatase MutT (NUDIX family)
VRDLIIRRLVDSRLPQDVASAAAAGVPDATLKAWFRQPLRPAAVLIPLIEHADGLHVMLTERTHDLPDHPGQISFPGGSAEEQDADLVATALRESYEEVGLDPATVEVAGFLPAQAVITGYAVAPVVGFARPFEVIPDVREVASTFEVPLAFLLDRNNCRQEDRERGGVVLQTWEYHWGGHRIWGATAKIINELVEKLQ